MTSRVVTGAARTIARRPDVAHARAEVETRYRAAYPDGKPHAKQLDRLALLVDWAVRCYRHDGAESQRTHPQMAAAWARAGFEWSHRLTGRGKADSKAVSKQVHDYLGYLKAIGYLADAETVYDARGESSGIRLRWSADVAQLAAPTRPPRRRGDGDFSSASPPRSRFSGATSVGPSMGAVVGSSDGLAKKRKAAGASPACVGRRDQARLVDRCCAALAVRAALLGSEEPGSAVLAALPWLAEVDASTVAFAALRAYSPQIAPRLSEKRVRHLETAVRQLDRFADMSAGRPGVGLGLVIEFCQAPPAQVWPGSRAPFSLGYVAIEARRVARRWRRHERERRARRGPASRARRRSGRDG